LADLYLDHDVARDTARLLRARSHDVITAREIGSEHASDGAHLLAATQQNRVLVTHNGDDYLLLHDAWLRWFAEYSTATAAPHHAGILIIPQPDYRRNYWLSDVAAAEIDSFLARTADLMGRAYYWTPAHGWRER